MMLLQSETVTLSCGRIQVYENTFPMSQKRSRLALDAPELKNDSNSFDYFRKMVYPVLAAPSTGDVPTPEMAFAMPRPEWDLWYLAVWKQNPDWFLLKYSEEEVKTKVVEFRDKSKLTLSKSCHVPSMMVRLFELENDALQNPVDDSDFQLFRSVFYPKMAACVVDGDLPSAADAFDWPTSEIDKWYQAAKELNADWFEVLDEVSEQAQAALKEKEKQAKKKGTRKQDG